MKPNKTRDDGPVSEITILPDGRVYLFGLTRPLLELLSSLPVQESTWKDMLESMMLLEESPAALSSNLSSEIRA